MYKFCDVKKVNIFDPIKCAILKTETFFLTKLENKNKMFEFGFQKFQNSKFLFMPHSSLIVVDSNGYILYKWIFKNVSSKMNFEKQFKLINIGKENYSWWKSAELCKNIYNMTLPHLQNQKLTMEFVSYILTKNVLPMYTIFVGLIMKVSDLM